MNADEIVVEIGRANRSDEDLEREMARFIDVCGPDVAVIVTHDSVVMRFPRWQKPQPEARF